MGKNDGFVHVVTRLAEDITSVIIMFALCGGYLYDIVYSILWSPEG